MGLLFHQVLGFDLGTDKLKIYDFKEDDVTIEKNLLALREKNVVIAVGDDAYDMINRESTDVNIVSPMNSGRIGDILLVEAILHILLVKQKHYIGYGPTLYFAVPSGMTEVEKRAYASIARRGRFRSSQICLVEKPISDGIALGIPIKHTGGAMIINIGAQSTELSVIASSHIVLNKTVMTGGVDMDSAIAASIRRKNHFYISGKSAENLKYNLCVSSADKKEGLTIQGVDADNGLPRKGFVTVNTIEKACLNAFSPLINDIKSFVERIPPQIRTHIEDDGIYLTGGGSHINHLAALIENETGLYVNTSSLYERSTVLGLRKIIKKKYTKKSKKDN